MDSRIPDDFDCEWDSSDVVFHAQNADGKELLANKAFLAAFSPYFHTMFFSNFVEAKKNEIDLQCDYELVKEILQIIHFVGYNFTNGHTKYGPQKLVDLFGAADFLDFPLVRKICSDQILRSKLEEMAKAAKELGLRERKVTPQIPVDFGSGWDMSNVVLRTLDSEGQDLYANKAVLSVFSPFFRDLFSKDGDKTYVDLDYDYVAVKKILQIIHHVDLHFSFKEMGHFSRNILINLYKTADELKFPVVQKFCEVYIRNHPTVRIANIAHSLGLHDVLMSILRRMRSHELGAFLEEYNIKHLDDRPFFTKRDVVTIFENNYNGTQLRRLAVRHSKPLNLAELSKELVDPRVDVTRKWKQSDVALATQNSEGRLLYSIKRDLASYSDYFQKMFFGKDPESLVLQRNTETEEAVPVEVEYATMKEILSFIHRCDLNFSRKKPTLIHPVLLYDMYQTASVDNLDIPIIKEFCHSKLLDHSNILSFEVALKLGFRDASSRSMKYASPRDLYKWVMSKGKTLCYLRNGQEVVISINYQQKVLNVTEAGDLQYRLYGYVQTLPSHP